MARLGQVDLTINGRHLGINMGVTVETEVEYAGGSAFHSIAIARKTFFFCFESEHLLINEAPGILSVKWQLGDADYNILSVETSHVEKWDKGPLMHCYKVEVEFKEYSRPTETAVESWEKLLLE